MLNLHCQLDAVWSHLGDKLFGHVCEGLSRKAELWKRVHLMVGGTSQFADQT